MRNHMTYHAEQRSRERLSDVGFDPITIGRMIEAASMLAERCLTGTEAIRIVKLDAQVNAAWGNRSNGDNIWAIVRDNRLITMFLRRSDQASGPLDLDVDRTSYIG